MYKSTILFALFTLSAKVIAIPPACLLAAVNTQPNPADLNAICGKDSPKVEDQINSLCGKNVNAAMNAYAQTCKDSGHQVSITSSASSMPSNSANGTYLVTTAVYNSSCSCTQTSVLSVSGSGSATGFNSPAVPTGSGSSGSGSGGSSSGGASSTSKGSSSSGSGAGSVVPQQGGAFVAAAIALAGLVVAL